MLVRSIKKEPAEADQLIQDFLVGASDEGAAELYKVYDDVLRDRRFGDEKAVAITEAHGVAFRRLVVAASEAKTQEVRQATSHAFHGEPYDLAPIAAKEIDLLLGSAAILDGKLTALNEEKPKKGDDFWERKAREQHFSGVSEAFVRWACRSAAKKDKRPLTRC